MLASAYAHELPQYGLKVGLTNYAAGIIKLISFWTTRSFFFLTEKELNYWYMVSSLLHWTPLGPQSPEKAWNGWRVWGKCWGKWHIFGGHWLKIQFFPIWMLNLSFGLCVDRQLGRIFRLSQLRTGGLSVLFLMLVSWKQLLGTVFLVLSR